MYRFASFILTGTINGSCLAQELMEHAMKTYSALSVGETIVIECSGSRFKLDVVETLPNAKDDPPNTTGGICLYGDLDLEADFAPAKDTLPDPNTPADTPISGEELESLAAQALAAAAATTQAPEEAKPGPFQGQGRSLGGGGGAAAGDSASRPSSARRLRDRVAASRHAGAPRAMSPIQASPSASPAARRGGGSGRAGGGSKQPLRSGGSQRSLGSTSKTGKPLRKAGSERNVRAGGSSKGGGVGASKAPPPMASPGFKPDSASSKRQSTRSGKQATSTGAAKARPAPERQGGESKQARGGSTQAAAPGAAQSFGLGFYSGQWRGVDLGTPPAGITRLQRAAVDAMGADATVRQLFTSPRGSRSSAGGGFTDEGGNILAETAARDLSGTARMLGAQGASTAKFHGAGTGHALRSPAAASSSRPRVSPVTGGAAASDAAQQAAGLRLGGAASSTAARAGRSALLERLQAEAHAAAAGEGKAADGGVAESKFGTPPRKGYTAGRVSPIMSPGAAGRLGSSATKAAAQGRAVRQAASAAAKK